MAIEKPFNMINTEIEIKPLMGMVDDEDAILEH